MGSWERGKQEESPYFSPWGWRGGEIGDDLVTSSESIFFSYARTGEDRRTSARAAFALLVKKQVSSSSCARDLRLKFQAAEGINIFFFKAAATRNI